MMKALGQSAGTQKTYYPLLDVLRGPAAMLVFAEHWRNLFFVDFSELTSPSAFTKAFYLLTGAGHQAVMIFFVLSGCVIAHVMQTMIDRDNWSWTGYLSARLTRLWVVLIPALALTAGWDFLGMSFDSDSASIYSGSGFGNVMNTPVSESSGWTAFLGNAFFLQTILVPTFGSNGPLWSIAFEFVYYLVYPAIVITCLPKSGTRKRVLCALLAAALLYGCGRPIAGSFLIWLAGAVCYTVFRKWPANPKIALLGFVLGTTATLLSVIGSRVPAFTSSLDWNVVIAACTAIALYFGLSVHASKRLMFVLRPFHALSAISYSVYLLHMPLFVFIASRYFNTDSVRWSPDTPHLLTALAIAALVFTYCLMIWFVTEHQTGRLRALFKSFPRTKV